MPGWFGWWKSERAEALTQDWLDAPDEAGQRRRRRRDSAGSSLDEAPTMPLGQFTIRTAFRSDLTGMMEGTAPYPWGVRRA